MRLKGDKKNRLQKLLEGALTEKFTDFDGTSVQSFVWPRLLSTDAKVRPSQKAERKANKWLERVQGDVVIWGDDLSGGTTQSGKLHMLGRNRTRTSYKTITLDILGNREDLEAAFLATVQHELMALRDIVYQNPKGAKIELVPRVIAKCESLAATPSKALPEDWKQARADDAQRLRNVLLARVAPMAPKGESEKISEDVLAVLDPYAAKDALKWAQTALSLAKLTRRRAFYEVDVPSLEEALARLERARTIFDAHGQTQDQAECWLETTLCLSAIRETQPYPSKQYDTYTKEIGEAVQTFVTFLPDGFQENEKNTDPAQLWWTARLLAVNLNIQTWQNYGFCAGEPSLVFERLSASKALLDNEAWVGAVEACILTIVNYHNAMNDLVGLRSCRDLVLTLLPNRFEKSIEKVFLSKGLDVSSRASIVSNNLKAEGRDRDITITRDLALQTYQNGVLSVNHGTWIAARSVKALSDLISEFARLGKHSSDTREKSHWAMDQLTSIISRTAHLYPRVTRFNLISPT